MNKVALLLATALSAADGYALSSEAIEGEALYPACHVCHNPALGPPMWGVKRR